MNFTGGTVIGEGKYKLIESRGAGSYGHVWLAEDVQLSRQVAVKSLHQHMGRLADLLKEAKAQARLSHPNICVIYEVDTNERFIAMEYVEGLSMEEYLKNLIREKRWLSLEESKALLLQCFDAISYAHEQSVVHGDIKPGNIMLTESSKSVKITDFGVAKIISEEAITAYSMGGARRLGSATYTAPEVLTGEPRNARSDIFSFGIVAYLMLTGSHPFYNTHPSGLFGIREMLVSDFEPKSPKDISPAIPDKYSEVVMKLIAKNPEQRYENLRRAYAAFVDLGLVCRSCQAKNTFEARYCNQCGHSLELVIEDEYRKKSPLELQQTAYQLNGLGDFTEAIRFCDEAIKKNPHFFQAYQTRSFALSNLGRFDEALEGYQTAITLLQNEPGGQDGSRLAKIHTNMSFCYERLGKYHDAKRELEIAIELDGLYFKAQDLLQRGREKGYW